MGHYTSEAKVDLATIALARIKMGFSPASSVFTMVPDEMTDAKHAAILVKSVKATNCPQLRFAKYLLNARGEEGYPERNPTKALEYLQEASDEGYPEAQASLAAEYFGQSNQFPAYLKVERNVTLAKNWAELASRGGDLCASVLLAVLLKGGDGIVSNWKEAT